MQEHDKTHLLRHSARLDHHHFSGLNGKGQGEAFIQSAVVRLTRCREAGRRRSALEIGGDPAALGLRHCDETYALLPCPQIRRG